MPTLRTLLLIAALLALSVSGLASGDRLGPVQTAAADSQAAAEVPHASCHGAQDAPTPSATPPDTAPDCCDDGSCGCGCLHPMPLVMAVARSTSGIAPAQVPALGAAAGVPGGDLSRQLRPPIA
jgi:hypothetical protein